MREAQTQGLARRALGEKPDRSWPRLFAERLNFGAPYCPPVKGLPEEMRRQLEELAAQRNAAAALPEASGRGPVE